jgi:hypothetical protein
MTLQPIADYTGYYNCPGAGIAFVHPVTGNLYCWASEKRSTAGASQDLSIYRMTPGVLPATWELVKRYTGGVDAAGLITPVAGMKIDRYGALIVTFACVPKGGTQITTTGYVNVWDWIPGVDLPWDDDTAQLKEQIVALQHQVAMLQQQIDAIGSGGSLSAEDRASLDWTAQVRALE